MVNWEEKRKHQRINFSAPLEIATIDAQLVARGLVCNISLGGLGIETDTPLASGNDYRFTFSFSDGKRIKIAGRIMWSFVKDSGILHGVRFVKLGLWNRWALGRIIRQYLTVS